MGSGALLLQCLGCERQGDFCGVKRHPHHPCLWFLKETARSSMIFLPYHDLQRFSYHQNSPKWGEFWIKFRNKTWRASASEPQSMDDLGHGKLATYTFALPNTREPGTVILMTWTNCPHFSGDRWGVPGALFQNKFQGILSCCLTSQAISKQRPHIHKLSEGTFNRCSIAVADVKLFI